MERPGHSKPATVSGPHPFVEAFVAAYHRPPRILHIGNIANNAYLNARILNQAGFDCDVICSDYYHIMGCPEWEDADFEGGISDPFRPQWWMLDLGGFERPRWFAQGPQALCLDYLIAKRRDDQELADRLWQQLSEVNYTANVWSNAVSRVVGEVKRSVRWEVSRMRRPIQAFKSLASRLNAWSGRNPFRQAASALAKVSFVAAVPVLAPAILIRAAWRWIARWASDLNHFGWRAMRADMAQFAARNGLAGRAFVVLGTPFAVVFAPLSAAAFGRSSRSFVQKVKDAALSGLRRATGSPARADAFALRVSSLVDRFAVEFPDRADRMDVFDLAPYSSLYRRWTELFRHYDMIQAYSTDGILPLLSERPYFCFEHGTLREIPYRETPEGRRTALAYRLAQHVFVTNFDCVPSAERLAPNRFTVINHPFDEDHGLAVEGWEEVRAALSVELRSNLLVFFPTRHDWVKGTGYADKGNDTFLRAFGAARQAGISVGVVCCEWGANVAQSKSLIAELGCERHVKWVPPLPTVKFERMARAVHVVADQFVLGAFGGVMFKAMAAGAPILTYLKEPELMKQYPECPPVINCRTESEIAAALTRYSGARDELAALGAAGRVWIKRYHSKQDTVGRQAAALASVLLAPRY